MSSSQNKFSRRQLFLRSAGTFIGGAFAAGLIKAGNVFAQATAFVTDQDAVAKALKYVADVAKAKPDPRKDKAGSGGKNVPAAKQFCENCLQFTAGAAIGGKPAGKCNMIQSGAVSAKGWCSVWAQRPGT